MTKKIGDKKLGGVTSTTSAGEIQKTEHVGSVQNVKATSGVGGVGSAAGIGKRRATRVMSIEEREALMGMISEEAEKLFSQGGLPQSKKELVTSAVKMAVDAGLLPAEEDKKK